MKRCPHFGWTLSFLGVMFLFNACKKGDHGPGGPQPPEADWLLTSVYSGRHVGPGDWRGEILHRFRYDAFNLPVVHEEITDLIDPEALPSRVDSFFYNSQYQLARIISNSGQPGSYKETFTYGANKRKTYSLKYQLNNNSQYILTDSTAYRYQGNTIRKITYHFIKPGTDTAIFVYDGSQNLISASLGEYGEDVELLQLYDTTWNPAIYFNVNSLELDPYDGGLWNTETLLMMQSPQASRNNYLLRRNQVEYTYGISGLTPDRRVTWIESERGQFEGTLNLRFTYIAAN